MAGDNPEDGFPINGATPEDAAFAAAPLLFDPSDPLDSFDVFVFPVFQEDGLRFTVLVDGLRVRFDESDGSRNTESVVFTVKRYVPPISLAAESTPRAM